MRLAGGVRVVRSRRATGEEQRRRMGAGRLETLIAELKRRHVFRVAVAYAAIGFAAVSVASDFLPALRLPDWTVTLVAIAVVVGFPIAVVLAWIYEITPGGVRRTDDAAVAPAADKAEVTGSGRAASFVGVGIVLSIVILGALSQFNALPFAPASHGGSIAVLPFEDQSGDAENEFFASGIHEEVMTQLYRLDGITVISRMSVMQYRGTSKPASVVGQELGVGTLLQASVRRAGDRVRIHARLIDAATDRQIWADSYDRDLTDVLAIQADIAQHIADALRARLSPSARAQLAQAGSRAVDPAMYDIYLRALYDAGEGRHEEAVAGFLRALDIDPSYAPAYAGMARSHYVMAFFGEQPPEQAFGALKSAAARALQLDAGLADAHAAMALYDLHHAWDWKRADEGFRRALELSPNHAQVRHDYAHYLLAVGRTRESVEESARAVRLDPGNTMLKACAGWHDFSDREYDNAVAQAMGALMMMPGSWWPEIILGWAYLHRGDNGQAIAALRSAVANSGGRPFAVTSLAQGLAHAGERTPARRLLAELEASATEPYVSAYDVAAVHAALGNEDEALLSLERALAERSAMLVNIGWDPRFDALREQDAFRAITTAMKLPERPPVKPAPRRKPATGM
jgi:TolB-like protein/Tfp pilus assembly protein PilF